MKHKKQTFTQKIQSDFSKENFIEGGIIRPAILMLAFISFLLALYLLLIGNLKWGGSLILFSFIVNMYSIYESLTDKESIFRSLNLVFKLSLFIIEVIAFNYIILLVM